MKNFSLNREWEETFTWITFAEAGELKPKRTAREGRMKTLTGKIEDTIVALVFVEAGEFETARELLRGDPEDGNSASTRLQGMEVCCCAGK